MEARAIVFEGGPNLPECRPTNHLEGVRVLRYGGQYGRNIHPYESSFISIQILRRDSGTCCRNTFPNVVLSPMVALPLSELKPRKRYDGASL